MSRDDFEALFAGLSEEEEVQGLSPGLAELLHRLGVSVHKDASGLNLMTLASDADLGSDMISDERLDALQGLQGSVGINLESMLEHMNADQLKQVAKRFNESANANRVAESKKAIRQALSKPALLDKVVAELSPLEHALLSEVKRRGGAANGWSLIVYAALRGLTPDKRPGTGSVYKQQLSRAPGLRYLGVLIRDGLLIPASNVASWFSVYHYYGSQGSPEDDVLYADPKVLAKVPDEPPLEPQPLDLKPLESITPTAPHPTQTLLELFDLLQLVIEEGGVTITQRDTVSKPLLNRLTKRRPRLKGRLERLLQLGLMLGLLDPPASESSKDPWRVSVTRLSALRGAPLALSYSFMVDAFLQMPTSEDDPWASGVSSLISKEVAQRALLESLAVLPEHPVRMKEALGALWERSLKYVVRAPRWMAEEDAEPERPAWFTGVLRGAFLELGLVAVAELKGGEKEVKKPKTDESKSAVNVMYRGQIRRVASSSEDDSAGQYALSPTLGFAWLKQGQALQEVTEPPELEKVRALQGLDPETGKPFEPSLLIQPNFDILVYLDKLTPFALTVLSAADCTRVDAQTASYTLSRGSLYRALESGLPLDDLLQLLQDHSMGVPDNVTRSLRDWASRRERLRVQEDVRLLEYATSKERDAALKKLERRGARALAERFILIERGAQLPKVKVRHQYNRAPSRTLRFLPAGHFKLEGATDLAGRAVLAQLATQDEKEVYHLNVDKVRAGALTQAARDALTERAQGGLPPQLEALINVWSAQSPAPTVATIRVFQHPSAAALSKHPKIAPHLGTAINETSFLVQEGHEERLEQHLAELGIEPAERFKADVKPQVIDSSAMQTGLNTRKTRELIEAAIAQGRGLELRYHTEKTNYSSYGYNKKTKGKLKTEKIDPDSVTYLGSTPYLLGRIPGKKEVFEIRIGYIEGIAVL